MPVFHIQFADDSVPPVAELPSVEADARVKAVEALLAAIPGPRRFAGRG